MGKKETNQETNQGKLHNPEHNEEQKKAVSENENLEKENLENENLENTMQEEKKIPLEEKWLNDILEHEIKVPLTKEESEQEYTIKKVGQIIDPEKDIWFSKKKKKPILKETGTRKLINATGATFPKIVPIEKQSDAPSKDREQVWIEATVLFPNGETHEEYGIANLKNCQDSISQANLPIMARKRAIHRAFLRSEYIGLFDVFDENEVLDVRGDEEQYQKLVDKNREMELKYKKLVNQLCKEIKTESGELVWTINDIETLVGLAKGSSVSAYVASLRIRHLNKMQKTN